jgi:hypothetical protein
VSVIQSKVLSKGSNFNPIVSMFIFAPALVFSSVAALIKLLTGLGPPTLMAPVALLILNSCSTVFVNMSVSMVGT